MVESSFSNYQQKLGRTHGEVVSTYICTDPFDISLDTPKELTLRFTLIVMIYL
jgi:hypothetical protein